jgi:DNA-binding NarL/FixJ family response regulator
MAVAHEYIGRREVATTLEEETKSNRMRPNGRSLFAHSPSSPPAYSSAEDQTTDEGVRALQRKTHKIFSRNATISVAVIDEYSLTREAITRSLRDTCKFLNLVSFMTSNQCLEYPKHFDVILYYDHENILNQNNNDEKLANFKELSAIAPVILLCDIDSFAQLRAAFDCGVRGCVPAESTTLEVAIEIIYLVRAGGIFVPPSSLSPRWVKRQVTRDLITTQKFTPRQTAVLDHLKLGKTNKVIAFELNMSESSVKTHIQNIMKKMKATNRTELVCLVQKMEMNGIEAID